MALLLIILSGFLILSLFHWLLPSHPMSLGFRGRLSLSIMLVFTGGSHFVLTEDLMTMVPPEIPYPWDVVFWTGILEIAAAVGLMIPGLKRLTGMLLILFFIAVFPANIYSAFYEVGLGGHVNGPSYLWFRAPLQLFFIIWTAVFMRK